MSTVKNQNKLQAKLIQQNNDQLLRFSSSIKDKWVERINPS